MRSTLHPCGARNGISYNYGRFRKSGIAHLSIFRTKSCYNASRCSMPGTSRGWWHCNWLDHGPNVRHDHFRTAFAVSLIRTLMCKVVVSCVQSPFPHMCCQLPAKPALHPRFVDVPLDIMLASAGASQLVYLFITSPIGSRGPFQHAVGS